MKKIFPYSKEIENKVIEMGKNKYKNKLKKIIKPGYIEKILKDIEEV